MESWNMKNKKQCFLFFYVRYRYACTYSNTIHVCIDTIIHSVAIPVPGTGIAIHVLVQCTRVPVFQYSSIQY